MKFIFLSSVLPFDLQFSRVMFYELSYLLLAHHPTKSHATNQDYTYKVERHERNHEGLKEMGVLQFGSISRVTLRCINEAFLRVNYVGTNTQTCGCTLRTSCGFSYSCELGRYISDDKLISIDVVHVYLRKLSMEGQQEVDTDDGSEMDMTSTIEASWRRFVSLDVIGKRELKSRMCEISYPDMTLMCPPPHRIKT